MKIGGQTTGFTEVTKPYVLRDGPAKGLNEHRRCFPLLSHAYGILTSDILYS
jgi:hypothetical protein